MIPKIIVLALLLVVTMTLVQGLPRTHRFKPVVNLNREKLNTTEKPIELRKSTLFPKSNKKYVVTDKPLPRMTAPSSYKYFLARRPLMLKFEPLSTFSEKSQPVPHQSLMKKVKFVVSTPSPSEEKAKTDYWENNRPIHIRYNKTSDDNVLNNTVPQKLNEHKDKMTPQPRINNTTTTGSTKVPKNESRENILLIVNEEDFKSNPNAITNEVSDIIALVNKLHETKENITNNKTITPQPSPSSLSSTRVTESSSINPTHVHTIRNEENIHRQTPNEDVVEVVYLHPKSDVELNSSFFTENTTTTLSPVQKDAKTKSYSLKGNKIEINETSAPEIVFIPVNLNDLKSHPDLIAEEVKNVVNDITKNASPVTESSTSTTVAIFSTTPSTTSSTLITTNAIKTTPKPQASVEPEIINTAKGELFPSSNNSSEHSQNPNDDVENVIYRIPTNALNVSKNDVTTKIHAYPAVESTNMSSPEILFMIPNEVKNMDISTSTSTVTAKAVTVVTTSSPATTTTSATSTTPWIKISEDQTPNTDVTTKKSETAPKEEKVITSNSSPNIFFLPANFADIKSHLNTIEDEIKDVVNLLDDTPKNKKKNETTVTFSPNTEDDIATTTFIKEVVANTTSREHEIITSTLKPSNKHMSDPEIRAETSEKHRTPEIIFIPLNLKDFKSHPNGVIDEVQDIVNNMDKPYPSDVNNLTDKSPTTTHNDQTTDSSTNPLPMQHDDKAIKSGSDESMTTENSLPTNVIILESFSTTEADVNSSKISSNDLITENSQTDQNLTAEKLPEVVFIPVNLQDLESNPVIADEVKDIVNYMNKLHPHDNVTAAPVLQKNTTQESFSPIPTDEARESFSSMPTQEILSTASTTESSVGKYSQNLETDPTTESSVKSTSDANPLNKANHVTTENLSREIVFIPIKLEELKTNPDLVADEVKDIFNYMNEKDITNNNTTNERYTTDKDTPSIKTSNEIPEDTTTLQTSAITETIENVPPKYIIIEPIEVTAMKDEDENDIYVGNFKNRPKFTNKQNDSEKTKGADKGGKSNSISDDISDVIYVIKKNNNNT